MRTQQNITGDRERQMSRQNMHTTHDDDDDDARRRVSLFDRTAPLNDQFINLFFRSSDLPAHVPLQYE